MPSQRAGGARFITRQYLYLTKEDLAEIDRALLAAFPRLRFVRCPDLVDHEATKASDAYREARQRTRWPDVPVIAKPESEWTLIYYDGLQHAADEFSLGAWVEPEHWRPEWKKSRQGYPKLVNGPELEFDFRPGRMYDERSLRNLPGCSPGIHRWIREGYFGGVYYPWQPEQLSFLRRVRRIFDKHTTNQYVQVDWETLKPIDISVKGGMVRIGRHAAAWAMAHPRHYIDYDLKPIEWAERYPGGWTNQ